MRAFNFPHRLGIGLFVLFGSIFSSQPILHFQ